MATLKGTSPVYIAPGCSAQIGKVLKQMGATHAFLVTDEGLVKIGMALEILAHCTKAGLSTSMFSGVVPNPTISCIDAGTVQLQRCPQGTVVISLGGGSVMDAAKCIQVMSAQGAGASIKTFVSEPTLQKGTDELNFMTLLASKQPALAGVPKIVAVPTTSGTGSETNGACVVTDDATHKKLFFVNDAARASAIFLDPALTVGMPKYPTASCGFDVLAHALEAFTSRRTNDFSDGLALAAIKLVAHWLPKVMADPKSLEARSKMQMASFMAASAFDSAQLGLMHATGHQLTSLYGQAHGQTLATMMPHVMRYNIEGGVMVDKYAQVAMAFGAHDPTRSAEENAHRAVDAVARLSIEIGTAKSIEAMGGSEADVPELAQRALLDVSRIFGMRPATREALEAMFRAALKDDVLYPAAASKL